MKINNLKCSYLAPVCKVFAVQIHGVVCESFNPNNIEGFSEELFTF